MKKICVTSPGFSQDSYLRERLKKFCKNAKFNIEGKSFTKNELVRFVGKSEGVIIGLEIFDKKVIDCLPNLKIISKYGVGLDNIDINYAKKKGVKIGWEGGLNRRSVSEQTLSFMLSLISNQFYTSSKLKNGIWHKEGGNLLSKKTISIIGCGYIGTDLIKLLNPFECNILINDIKNKSAIEKKYSVKQVSLNEALKKGDIITLHVPISKNTKHLINEEKFKMMKPEAFLINLSRGSVVKQNALKNALKNKSIAGAGLDVFENEPVSDIEFLKMDNLIATPHIGGSAIECIHAMGNKSIQNLIEFYNV